MPTFSPFSGLRYATNRVAACDVICPPYDVISPEEQLRLERVSPFNAVRVELPREHGPGDRYDLARAALDSWRDQGILVREASAVFYGHRMVFVDSSGTKRATTGVIGAVGLEPPGSGILPHERTTPKAKDDRLNLLRKANANISPIWGLTSGKLTDLITVPERPVEHCTDSDGVVHQLWPIVDDETISAISNCVGAAPVIIADGHHRYETALAYQAERRQANRNRAGDYDAVMALVVELSDDQLAVEGINRLLDGFANGFDLASALAPWFDLEPIDTVDSGIGERMRRAGSLAVITTAGAWLARPRPGTLLDAEEPELDSSLLDVALAQLPDHELSYQHGWDRAANAVATHGAQAAVLIRPVTVEQISRIGRGGKRMPAKTTFFWPKPRTGMVFREVIG